MKYIFAVLFSVFIVSSANASRCGLAVTFVNSGETEKSIHARIDWPGMEIEQGEDGYFPGWVAHPIKLGAKEEKTESFVFPCGYSGDPEEFWVNYGVVGDERINRVKHVKGKRIVLE